MEEQKMRIVQRGINLRVTKPKPIICPKCGCAFEVQSPRDVIHSAHPVNTNFVEQMIVICPNSSCRFEHRLSSEKIQSIKQSFPDYPWDNGSNTSIDTITT